MEVMKSTVRGRRVVQSTGGMGGWWMAAVLRYIVCSFSSSLGGCCADQL